MEDAMFLTSFLSSVLAFGGHKSGLFPVMLNETPSLCDLTRFSDTVLFGEVITHRYPSKYGSENTTVTVVPLEFLKGENTAIVEFLIPGGHFGDQSLDVPGMPLIIENSQFLLFLRGESIAGFDKGIYAIYDEQTWHPIVGSTIRHPMWSGENSEQYFVHYSIEETRKQIALCK